MAFTPRIPATVGPFTFAYPHLTSPDSEGKFADNKYKVDGIDEPNSAAMKDARKKFVEACKALGVTPTEDLRPVKAEMVKDSSDPKGKKKKASGNYVFRAKSQYAPGISDASGKPVAANVLKKLKIGAGSVGLIQGYFSNYEMKGEEGVSFTLEGIQLISVSAGGGSSHFEAYEGGGWTPDTDEGDDMDDTPEEVEAPDSDDSGGLDI